ncbi:MAG: DUF3105 domain-containing protein [Actinobacteria bacterium]|nr:DUF3105 domain-containing protein [Actinomycetota bacterium]
MAQPKPPANRAKGKSTGKTPAKTNKANKSAKAAKSQPARTAKTGSPKAGGATRSERLEAARRQRQRRGLYLRLAVGGAVLAAIGAAVYAGASSQNQDRSLVADLTSGPGDCAYDTKFDGTARTQSEHIPLPTYTVDPPAGGAHEPSAAPPGFYNPENVPSDGKLVHAMEHGFVVLWYRPDLSAEDRQELEKLSDRFGRELIVAPRASLEGEAAVTAWHRRLVCRELDPEAVALFTSSFKDQGPEKGFL